MALIPACVFKRQTYVRLVLAGAYGSDVKAVLPPCGHGDVSIYGGNQAEHLEIFVGAISRMVNSARVPPNSHLVSLLLQRAAYLSGASLKNAWLLFPGVFVPKQADHVYRLTDPDVIRGVFSTRLSLLGLKDTPLWRICDDNAVITNGTILYKHLLGISRNTYNTPRALRDARIINNMLTATDPLNISPFIDWCVTEDSVWAKALSEAFRLEPDIVVTKDMRQVGGLCRACMATLYAEGDRLVRPWEYENNEELGHTCVL